MWLKAYNLCWSFLAVFFLPFTLKKDRFRKRWALQVPVKSPHKRIWIHALSVGEVLSALPLVEYISSSCSNNIAFTVTTQRGMEIAVSNLKDKVETLSFFPFDFFWSVKRFTAHLNPLCFVLIETDIWPFLINYLYSKGIKCFLVNGRISPATYRKYSRLPWLTKEIFNCFELCMVQSEQDRKRLLSLGISRAKVINTGNIKFDRNVEFIIDEEKMRWKGLFKIRSKDIVLIAGSTHPGEEKIILDVFKKIRKKVSNIVLVIAPRNIDRVQAIYSMCKSMKFNTILRSQSPPKEVPSVIIIDTIGELARLYSIADIAFVGGSLVPFGGHNLIEPVSTGCPVIFGPYMFNFKDISTALINTNAGIMVKTENELYYSILRLIEDPLWRRQVKESCRLFIYENRGATERVISLIKSRL